MKLDRDGYFHRVQMTQNMATAIEGEVKAFTGETWKIEFSEDFFFRMVDKTDPQITRDYGWFVTLDDVAKKFQAIFPTLEFKALTA